MDTTQWEGDGNYLTVKVLDFLDRRLAGGITTWKQLAGEMDYSSVDVDKFEADGLKIGQSSTKCLLRDWENRRGGCDMVLLKKLLENIGRRDIVRDLKDEFEMQGKKLVQSRSSPATILQEGQDVCFVGKVYTRSGQIYDLEKLEIIPPQQEARLSPDCLKILEPQECRNSLNGSMEQGPQDSSAVVSRELNPSNKRNSDPLQRRDVSPSQRDQSWSGGSMESIPKRKDSPKNLKKTHSEVFDGKSIEDQHTQTTCRLLRTPPEVRKEEVSYQTQGDYGSLQSNLSPVSVQDVGGQGGASPGKEYFLLSSHDAQDRQWCKKLCSILRRKGHVVHMVHEIPQDQLFKVFYCVKFVVVIYTEKYRKEFQSPGTSNQLLFQQMQLEHKRNNRVNHRFIPVYDVKVIRQLPDALLNGDYSERKYILDLLSSNKHRHDGSSPPSSAPSQGAGGGARGMGGARGVSDGAMPISRNNNTSQPVIIRDYHSPQNHPKPTHSDKKEHKFFWSKKGK